MSHSERLSALDAAFLDIEHRGAHMHVGAVGIFERGPLTRPGGAVDFDRLRAHVGSIIGRNPRYRQRLVTTPLLGTPAWVDDDRFLLDFHLRHTRLPAPGDLRQLKRLAGRVFSQRLDRDHPLWEMWIVEGLEGDRFALIAKLHHCMIDGVAGNNLLTTLLRGTPDDRLASEIAAAHTVPGAPAPSWQARPAPGPLALLGRELRHRADGLHHLARMAQASRAVPGDLEHRVRELVGGVGSLITRALRPTARTSFNPPRTGPHRRFDWVRLDLAELKAVKRALGGTVNDVALAIVAGALRRAMQRRGIDTDHMGEIRALVPVNVRPPSRDGALGNHVAMHLVPLPCGVAEPRARLRAVTATMDELKRGDAVGGVAALEELADATGAGVVAALFKFAGLVRAFNVTATNVPGPPFPLYLLGSRLQEIYPLVPLFEHHTVGLALFSYAGAMHVGVAGDWHATPDLHDLVLDLEAEHTALVTLAGLPPRTAAEPAIATYN
ncbi:MAG: wax ester/triacylglycerol synthase family O-acyltransferase [Myxococcales bacterium]|nr:wax ester/triacylglycerol synthase family O-acyltransferase [Myxococcales bacterium]